MWHPAPSPSGLTLVDIRTLWSTSVDTRLKDWSKHLAAATVQYNQQLSSIWTITNRPQNWTFKVVDAITNFTFWTSSDSVNHFLISNAAHNKTLKIILLFAFLNMYLRHQTHAALLMKYTIKSSLCQRFVKTKHKTWHDYNGLSPLITVIIIMTRPDTLAKTANAIIAESLTITNTGISRPRSFKSSMHGRMYASSEQPTAPENSIDVFNN